MNAAFGQGVGELISRYSYMRRDFKYSGAIFAANGRIVFLAPRNQLVRGSGASISLDYREHILGISIYHQLNQSRVWRMEKEKVKEFCECF